MEEHLWTGFNKKYSFFIFYLGVLLLPSAFGLATILLLLSSIIGFKNNKKFFQDKNNIAFCISSIFMIISCIVQSFNYESSGLTNWETYLSWIGLTNWIPLYIFSWGFQPYLRKNEHRKRFAIALLAGTFPVLITGIGQVFFDWHGPYNILNGFIIWYSRSSENNVLTGLFNNANYAGAWLVIVLPISFAFLVKKENSLKRFISFIFIVLIITCIILTNSRSAWIGLLLGSILFFGSKSLKWIIPIIISLVILILFSANNDQLQLIPKEALDEFTNFQYLDRFKIWSQSIRIISSNPIFGSGAASFSEIYKNNTGLDVFHSHNLIFELAVSYGLPATLFTIIPVILIIKPFIKKLLFTSNSSDLLIERSLLISLIIILSMHMVDIQYFDGRISIAIWLLIAALRVLKYRDLKEKNP